MLDHVVTWVRESWLASIPTWLVATGGVLGAATVIWKFLRPIRTIASWLTRRQRLTGQLQKLACGMQLEYFVATLKQPAQYVNHLASGVSEHVFVFPDAYVQVVADGHGKVGLFSVTTRSRRFRPKLSYYPTRSWPYVPAVQLGRTRFQDLNHDGLQGVHGWYGASNGGYAEAYYYGNPGHYQTYVFANNDNGVEPVQLVREAVATLGWFGAEERPAEIADQQEIAELGDWLAIAKIQSFRTVTVINTCAVIQPETDILMRKEDPDGGVGWQTCIGIGPDYQQVRTFPDARFRRLRRATTKLRDL